MAKLTKHWTESSVDNFLYRIAADFVLQLEQKIEAGKLASMN